MGIYSIKELEQLSGIKAHTIRIWEQRYGLLKPRRTDTNIRYYDDDQLKYLLNVALLSRHGYRVSNISKWTTEQFYNHLQQLYEQASDKTEGIRFDFDANDLITAMIDMDSAKFERIYDHVAGRHGFETTATELLYPFLEKVGVLWSIDQVSPAQEHFISCLIRQKIIAAIDGLEQKYGAGKKFLLFLPEGEYHEIGLLMAHYLLKKRGHKVYYFGQSLPREYLRQAVQSTNPDAALTFLVDPAHLNDAKQLIRNIQEDCGKITLFVAFRPTLTTAGLKVNGVHFLHSVNDLYKHL